MVTPNQPDDLDDVPDAVVDAESKGFPVVWLLPLVALLVGGTTAHHRLTPETAARMERHFASCSAI